MKGGMILFRGSGAAARHGHCAAAQENLYDSLKLLANAADTYEHAVDANLRLLNQACSRIFTSSCALATATRTTVQASPASMPTR